MCFIELYFGTELMDLSLIPGNHLYIAQYKGEGVAEQPFENVQSFTQLSLLF